jgi:hypothetical protein
MIMSHSAFFLAVAGCSSLQQRGGLPCAAFGMMSVGGMDSLQCSPRDMRRAATDERWRCWRSLAEPVAMLLQVHLKFT